MTQVPRGSAPIEVLLIEDNADDAALTVRALAHAKVRSQVRVIADGHEAGRFVRREGSIEQFWLQVVKLP